MPGKIKVDNIEANIDDMSPEIMGYVMERLYENGALDVSFLRIQMKKNRPGFKLQVVCNIEKTEELKNIIFKETTTTGVRTQKSTLQKLKEKKIEVSVEGIKASVKLGYLKNELVNVHPEYEDCKKVARKLNIPLKDVYEKAVKLARENV